MRIIVVEALLAGTVLVGCGTHSSAAACHALALGDCRLDSGCQVDSCDECSCTPVYRGCLGVDEHPISCPALGCAQPECCHDQPQCTDGVTACAPPGTPFGCGVCNTDPNTCASDAECMAQGASMICETIVCSCDGNKQCVRGCVDDSTCIEGQSCDITTARCVATSCAVAADCPADFDCDSHQCTRRSCTDDLDCNGYCVTGSCYSGLGVCTPPAA